jgi:hypothetical protein
MAKRLGGLDVQIVAERFSIMMVAFNVLVDILDVANNAHII